MSMAASKDTENDDSAVEFRRRTKTPAAICLFAGKFAARAPFALVTLD
jgi:hypothetical protein